MEQGTSVWPHVHSESPETFVGGCLSVCHRACAYLIACVCTVAPVLYAYGYCVLYCVPYSAIHRCLVFIFKDRCKRMTVKIADFLLHHGMATLNHVCERGMRCTSRAEKEASVNLYEA